MCDPRVRKALLFICMVVGLCWHFSNFPWLCKVFLQTSLHFASQFRNLQAISKLGGDFATISKLGDHFIAISKLGGDFVAQKCPAKWSFGCEIGIFHVLGLRSRFAAAKWGLLCCEVALVCQNRLRSCENSRRELQSVAEWFGNKMLISQKFSLGCEISQSSVFTLFSLCFCSDFAPIFFLSIS